MADFQWNLELRGSLKFESSKLKKKEKRKKKEERIASRNKRSTYGCE
jgi:hypothetical protein